MSSNVSMRGARQILAPVLFAIALAVAQAGEMRPTLRGGLAVPAADVTLRPQVFLPNWGGLQVRGGAASDAAGRRSFTLRTFENGQDVDLIAGTLDVRETGDAVEIAYRYRVLRERRLKQLAVVFDVPTDGYAGGCVRFDERSRPLTKTLSNAHVVRDRAHCVGLCGTVPARTFSISCDDAVEFLVQDNRAWKVPTFSVRLILGGEGVYRAGEERALAFRLKASGRTFLAADFFGIEIKAGPDWIPVSLPVDVSPGSALDFSGLRTTGVPAGCHGRVIARGDHFAFADSPEVPRRFYGANLCGYANVPHPEDAARLARRLAATGYNAVRFHHHECTLVKGDGVTLEEGAMARFDALVAECVRNGLYLTTDLFVSRRPISYRSLGIDRDGDVGAAEFRELVLVHPGAYANFLAFTRAFLGHRNPLTGRTLASEPALGWLALVNEGNLGNNGMTFMRRHPVFAERWRAFVAERRSRDVRWAAISDELPQSLGDWKDPQVGAYTVFMRELETDFARRVRRFLREEMRCDVLTSDMSAWHFPAAYQLTRALCHDYVDCHFYVDHPKFLGNDWSLPSRCPNANPFRGRTLGVTPRAFGRIWGKPFTVSEFNFAAPGRYRSVGGLAAGALAALQDWGAVWRFAWSHDAWSLARPREKAMRYFDVNGDPLALASERAFLCLFLRGDLKPLTARYAIALPGTELDGFGCAQPLETENVHLAWSAGVGSVLANEIPAGFVGGAVFPRGMKRESSASAGSDAAVDGAVCLSRERGSFSVATPATCGGFVERGGFSAGDLRVNAGDVPTTLWVSALDGRPLASSDRILVTHLTDVQNSGTKYADRELTVLTAWGRLPHLMRCGRAEVEISTGDGNWRVWALDGRGDRRREIASARRDGRICFTADIAAEDGRATYLYELHRARRCGLPSACGHSGAECQTRRAN